MRSVLLFIVAAGLLASTGCDSALEPPVPEPPGDPALRLVLQPYTADRQRALLTPVRPADKDAARRRPRLLQSAEVRVGGVPFQNLPADSVDLTVGPSYNYYSDSLNVEPGRTYDLTVRLDDGRTIEGQATVPGRFRGDAEGLRLFWRESEGAARYRVTIESAEGNPGDFYVQRLVSDTSLVVRPDEEFAEGEHFVTIKALGENLSTFVLDETACAGLEGAYGVFGAATTIVGPVTLERSEDRLETEAPARRPVQRLRPRSRPQPDL